MPDKVHKNTRKPNKVKGEHVNMSTVEMNTVEMNTAGVSTLENKTAEFAEYFTEILMPHDYSIHLPYVEEIDDALDVFNIMSDVEDD